MKNHNEEGSQKKESNASTENWHQADVLAVVRKRGSTLAKLSRENGLHERTLYNALERNWPKGEQIIADNIGVNREEIWPERYNNSEE